MPKGIFSVHEPREVALLDLKGNLVNLWLIVLLHLSKSISQHLFHPRQISSVDIVVYSTFEGLQ
jgi:hypothetical protein